MASQLFFSVLLSVLLCSQVAHCMRQRNANANSNANANAPQCNMRSMPRAHIELGKMIGIWYELRLLSNSEGLAPEDIWSDVTEVYTWDAEQPNKLNRTFNYRDPRNGRCSSIASKNTLDYKGNGEFSIKKWGKDYTMIVAAVDRAYQFAVMVSCAEILPNNSCIHRPDVKIMHRSSRMSSSVDNDLATFFRTNIPCVNYEALQQTRHSRMPCVRRRSTPVQRFLLKREMKWWQLESLRRMVSYWTHMF